MAAARKSDPDERFGMLFVCLGNICRSPLAEGIALHLASERGIKPKLNIDSAGTGAWHVGEGADERAVKVAKKNGIKLMTTARQVDPSRDFERFDVIAAMDAENFAQLTELGAPKAKLVLLRSFDPLVSDTNGDGLDVPDPYWGGNDGFQKVFEMIQRACEGLLDHAEKQIK